MVNMKSGNNKDNGICTHIYIHTYKQNQNSPNKESTKMTP